MVRSADELDRFAEQAARLGAHHLNVQIAGPPERLEDALALVDALVPAAERAPLPVFFETHRGRLSQDMALFLRLVACRPTLRLTGDLSHYVVAGEMDLPLSPQQLAGYDRILRNCEAFHGRVATAHQVQAPLGPHHRPWTELFLGWWRTGFDYWLARHGAADELSFMVELGPPPYAVTDAQGQELTDRWAEAKAMKDMVRAGRVRLDRFRR
ncbi:MAG: sugar phosphate isomerase/epimerase [Aliidongia sp.]